MKTSRRCWQADGRTLSGKGRCVGSVWASEATGWTAVVALPYTQELLRSQDRIYKTYLLIAAAALILALVFALQLSRSIAGTLLRRLMQTMRAQKVEGRRDLHVRAARYPPASEL
ncbi:MAG: hypothetical protein ACLTCV_04960 [Oscillospiraceae bacterium]